MIGEYYNTEESVKEYIKLAKDVNGIELIDKLKGYLIANSKLLEIGSGPGTDFALLNKYYNTTGSDNSEEFLKHLRRNYSNSEFLNLNAVSLKTIQKFDGIYANKVMHHLKDNELVNSIKRQHHILNPNGIICHSFWSGEESEIFKGLFVNYHNKTSLDKAFRTYFEILYLDYYKEFDEKDSILLIGKKK